MKDTESRHVQWELVGGGKEKIHFVPFQLFVGIAYHGKDMLNTNYPQLSIVQCLFFLSSYTCFLAPAWFCIKTMQHVSTCSFYSAKELNNGVVF
jgi:hypothetical protein